MNLFDGLDLVDYEFDIDADDFFEDDDEDWYDEYYDSDFEFQSDDEDHENQRYSESQIKRDRSHFMKQNADFQEDISQP